VFASWQLTKPVGSRGLFFFVEKSQRDSKTIVDDFESQWQQRHNRQPASVASGYQRKPVCITSTTIHSAIPRSMQVKALRFCLYFIGTLSSSVQREIFSEDFYFHINSN
jgi:hypothetical protein